MHQDDATCKCMQCNAKFSNLSDPFSILSNSLHICKLSSFLHISSTWSPLLAVLVAQALLFSHRGVAPPNFIEAQAPCQANSFYGKCIKMMQHANACNAMQNSPTFQILSAFFQILCISANFQAFCIFPPPGLHFLLCWWHKPCYFHTGGWPPPIL